jgi:cyclopropane-fatty-acyl-phospholipid synthase
MSKESERQVQKLLSMADIQIGGTNPQDIQIHDKVVYDRWLCDGSLGIGESYMDGLWTSNALDQTMKQLINNMDELESQVKKSPSLILYTLKLKLLNLQNKIGAKRVIDLHYNDDVNLFTQMLDQHMQYTCGYWNQGATDLQTAQKNKMQLIATKLKLEPGMQILDIGSGFGGLAYFLATEYDVQVTAVTLSQNQHDWATLNFAHPNITFMLGDYRGIEATKYDRIVSVGLLEHVGIKNYPLFFKKVFSLLKSDGIYLLHTIGSARTTTSTDEWIDKYIFPGGQLPSFKQIVDSIEEPFVIEDWHNFGENYSRTLHAWHQNITEYWQTKPSNQSTAKEFRMWEYYLLSCAGNFEARSSVQLWQIVVSKHGVAGGYKSVR